MTFLSRPPLQRTQLRQSVLALTVAALAVLALAVLFTAPARAIVTTVGGQKLGVEPHATVTEQFSFDPLTLMEYGGGPVMNANATYAIYWDPAVLRPGDPGRPGKYHGDWQQLVNQFLYDVGVNSEGFGNVFALTPQYAEAGGVPGGSRAAYKSIFRGGAIDRTTYPANGCTDPAPVLNASFACFTDQQLRNELKTFVAANNLHAGPGTIFFLFTPPGVTICADEGGPTEGHCSDSTKVNPWKEMEAVPSAEETAEEESYQRSFCSYHSFTSTASSETLLYAVVPWVAGTYGSLLRPANRDGSDCQDGTGLEQEPNQSGLSPDGTYDHALPDLLINQIAAQQIATITDPMLNGWNEPLTGNEAPDQCRNWFEGPPVVTGSGTPDEHTGAGHFANQTIDGHSYYLNTEFNQAADYYDYPGLRCELHNNLVPSFTPPTPVEAGDIVGFDGAESDITLEQSADATPLSQPQYRAIFSWSFGDGATTSGPGFSGPTSNSPLYASTSHAYQYGGEYQVTLTVTDAGGATATVSHIITVKGPPPPSSPGGPGGGSGGETGGSSGGTTTQSAGTTTGTTTQSGGGSGGGSGAPATPGPIAAATAANGSLTQTLRRGLLVNYTVNEQVAGRFEVLLDTHTAHLLGIGGPAAVGLPAGTAPSLIVGRALLVTTKGGRSAVRIKLVKRAAARLRHVRKLKLTLRLVVRNAAAQNPQSATVLSTVTLHR